MKRNFLENRQRRSKKNQRKIAIKKDYNTEIKIKNNAQTDKKTNKNRRGESVRDCGYCKRRDTYLSVKCN